MDTERDKERTRVADLLRVATQGDIQTGLKRQELSLERDKLDQLTDYQKDLIGIRGKELKVSQKLVGIREEANRISGLEAEARAGANKQLAERYEQEARKLKQTADFIDKFLGGEGDNIGNDVARKALGLPVKSPTEERQMDKDLVKAEAEILDLDNADAIPYMRFFNENTKGNYGYFWDTKRWNEVIKVDLSKLGGMKKAKDDALSLGISISDYLNQIYYHPNYKR